MPLLPYRPDRPHRRRGQSDRHSPPPASAQLTARYRYERVHLRARPATELGASVDANTASLPVSLRLCQTNPTTGACLATPASTVTTTIAANATPAFGIFVTGNATDVVWCAHGATHRQEEAFLEGRTTLPARQCSGELAHRLLMLLVPDFDKITGDLELHTLVQRDLPRTFFPDTFVKIGDRRVQCVGDLK